MVCYALTLRKNLRWLNLDLTERKEELLQKECLNDEELKELLGLDKGERTLKKYGALVRVSATLIGEVLIGKRRPGPAIARHFKRERGWIKVATTPPAAKGRSRKK
jgi:hypothetical protein